MLAPAPPTVTSTPMKVVGPVGYRPANIVGSVILHSEELFACILTETRRDADERL